MSAQPRRVAYLVPPSRNFAGIERVVHELATSLAKAHPDLLDVHVIFARRYDDPLLVDTAYTQHVLGVDRLRGLRRPLRALLAEHHFDLLVTPQVEASVISWTAAPRRGGPVVVPHLHGNPRIERADGSRRTRLAFTVFEQVVARDVPVVLAVAPSLRDYAQASIGRHTKVVWARNPVRDLGAGDRVRRHDEPFRFVNVGRLAPQKGQDILLEAFALARPRLDGATLTVVGAGPEEQSLRARCSGLDLDDVVTFTGYEPDPVSRLLAADCFVSSSRWEGAAVAIVEALQCGLPVLATDCEFGSADLVWNERLGTVVDPNDPSALAAGLVAEAARRPQGAEEEHRREQAARFAPAVAAQAHFSVLASIEDRR